jgi:hypothetical protein
VFGSVEGIAVFLGFFEVFDVQSCQQGEQDVTDERRGGGIGAPVVTLAQQVGGFRPCGRSDARMVCQVRFAGRRRLSV